MFFKSKTDVDVFVRKIFCNLEGEIERNLKSYDVAKWYFNVGDYDSAHSYINKFLYVDPENSAAQRLLVDIIDGLMSLDQPLSSSQGNKRKCHIVNKDDYDIEREEQPASVQMEASREVKWYSSLADVIQAKSCLNTTLERLTAPCMQPNHPELIERLAEVVEELVEIEVAMTNHNDLSKNFCSDVEETCVSQNGQRTLRKREDGLNNAFIESLQSVVKQNQDILDSNQSDGQKLEEIEKTDFGRWSVMLSLLKNIVSEWKRQGTAIENLVRDAEEKIYTL